MKNKKQNTDLDKDWEVRDRLYILSSNRRPLVFSIPSKHGKRPLLWWDDETGKNRELRYATNQDSPFVDEQKGRSTLGRIIFRDGALRVSKRKPALQKLLSLYHPLKDVLYYEHNDQAIAVDQNKRLDMEVDALMIAREMDPDKAEAILRVELGSEVTKMTSQQLYRDLLLFARRNPDLFMELAQDDNVELRNFGIRAVEAGLVKLSPDNRVFNWASNGRKIMPVPLDEHPYSALAAFFKTDEGLEMYKNIEKRLK